eukprot:811901-Pelagomonas_calceolata.AAC.1
MAWSLWRSRLVAIGSEAVAPACPGGGRGGGFPSAKGGCHYCGKLGHKDQAKTGGRMPLWYLPIPSMRNGGTCTPSLWLPAHSVHAHTGYLS